MRLDNMKIGARLALLGAFFLIALVGVGFGGANALGTSNAKHVESMGQLAVSADAYCTRSPGAIQDPGTGMEEHSATRQ